MGAKTWRLFKTDQEFLVHQGYIYVPLLMDPEIKRELNHFPVDLKLDPAPGEILSGSYPPPLISVAGHRYIQAVAAASLVDNFGLVSPRAWAEYRRRLLEQYSLTTDLWGITLDPNLITIVFHILPHFLRRNGPRKSQRLTETEILDHLRKYLRVPGRFLREAQRYQNSRPLKEALTRLAASAKERPPLPEGPVSGARLKEWWEESLKLTILETLRRDLLKEFQDREQFRDAQEERLALLLFLAEKGSLELNGFGFSRIGKTREYRIYKRTGPYALKDYYGRLYLFPDCRVAVSTSGPLRPVVLDHYKHPFLRRHAPGQEICLRSEMSRLTFSAKNAIQVLEEGINALFYGYDRRRRNGYHPLDAPPGKIRLVHFDDYRIPTDHPLIVSGQVEVKNRDT